jgi:uncharacterized damage-inducible protein DinB
MNQQAFQSQWSHIREMSGIAMRLVEQLPADKLDARPIPNMRTVKQLVVHLYGAMVKPVTLGIASGKVEQPDEDQVAATIKTKDDLLRYCRDCWSAAEKTAASVSDAQLAATVHTPWGFDMSGAACAGVVYDELIHHRGQLYCFVRALGAPEVPMMWDFEHNAAEFRAAATTA